jgi:hypothetical protein
MFDPVVVNAKVRELVRTLLGMPANSVRPANQNAPTGVLGEQFATVYIGAIADTGMDDFFVTPEAAPSNNVTEVNQGQRLFTASIQFFRGDALAKAHRLHMLMGMSAGIEALHDAGLGFVRAHPARDLTQIVDTYWEPRGQVDIEFHALAQESASLPTYGAFPIDITTSTTTHFEVTAP